MAKDSVEIASIFEQTESRFLQVKGVAGLDRGGLHYGDVFGFMALKLRLIKVSWDASNVSAVSATLLVDELVDFPVE